MIINFGSLNIDYVYLVDHFVQPGETLQTENMSIYPGGKGLNQSIAIARAGGNVLHAGKYGEGGQFLYELLKYNGVDVSYLDRTNKSNGHAIIQVDRHGENSILLYRGTNGEIDKKYINRVFKEMQGDEIILFQNENSLVEYAIKQAKEKGCKIIFNPAPMNDDVLKYPLELVDILIVNQTEGKMLSGKQDPNDILQILKYKYPKAKIILTLGGDGAWFCDKENCYHIRSYKAEKVVDTTAAGDTFIGYYLAYIDSGIDDKRALTTAAKAAAIAISRKGAATSIPTHNEIMTYHANENNLTNSII